MNKIDFDNMANREVDHCRKWDKKIINEKFPEVKDNFIPMWIADMDFKASSEIIEEFVNISQNGAFGYTYAYDGFYEAVIGWQKRRHNNNIEKDWITLSYGTVSTIHYMYQAFCKPGDKVLMNTPVYDPFAYAAEHNDVKVISNRLEYEKQTYYIDFEILENQLKTEKPKIYLLCSPHNPAGKVWDALEIAKIAELCLKYDVLLAVDEVHSEIILYGSFYSALQLEKKYLDNLILLTSPNKAFNLGGLKTSYSIIPNEKIRETFRKQLKKNSITSPNLYGVIGITTAYTKAEPWLDALTDYLRDNYEYTKKIIEEKFPTWKLMEMQASYLPWVDISETGFTATEITRRMANDAGVIIEDGSHYVANGENFIRLNIGTPMSILIEAMERMARISYDS